MRAMQNIFASKVLLGLFFIVIFASLAYAAPEDGGDSNAELGLPSSNLPLQEQVEMLKKALRKQPQFSLVGKLKPGKQTKYSINGVDFVVSESTRVNGDLKMGAYAEVNGPVQGSVRRAKSVRVSKGVGSVENKPKGHFDGQGPGVGPAMSPSK